MWRKLLSPLHKKPVSLWQWKDRCCCDSEFVLVSAAPSLWGVQEKGKARIGLACCSGVFWSPSLHSCFLEAQEQFFPFQKVQIILTEVIWLKTGQFNLFSTCYYIQLSLQWGPKIAHSPFSFSGEVTSPLEYANRIGSVWQGDGDLADNNAFPRRCQATSLRDTIDFWLAGYSHLSIKTQLGQKLFKRWLLPNSLLFLNWPSAAICEETISPYQSSYTGIDETWTKMFFLLFSASSICPLPSFSILKSLHKI